MDLKVLYRQVIMDHYKNPKNKGLKKVDPYHLVHLTNPSCGDDMSVEIIVENDQVVGILTIGDLAHYNSKIGKQEVCNTISNICQNNGQVKNGC